MEKKEEIKQKLSGFNSKAICLNEDEFVFKSISEKCKDKTGIIGVISQRWNDKNPDGIVITENGIEWHAALLASHVSQNGKKTAKSGNLSFKELAHYKCTYEEKMVLDIVTLTRTDLTDPKLLEISFELGKDENADDIVQICKAFESLASIETVEEVIPDEKRIEYLEAFIIEDDVNPIMRFIRGLLSSSFVTYKQAFAKYAEKSSWVLFYKHDLPTIVGWAFSLLYRRIYVLGALFIAIDLIVFFAVGEAWGLVAMVLLMAIQSLINPFIIYKRYTGILKNCSSNKMTEEQKIEVLKKKGGSNGYLAIVAGIIIIISTIAKIISFFSGDY